MVTTLMVLIIMLKTIKNTNDDQNYSNSDAVVVVKADDAVEADADAVVKAGDIMMLLKLMQLQVLKVNLVI